MANKGKDFLMDLKRGFDLDTQKKDSLTPEQEYKAKKILEQQTGKKMDEFYPKANLYEAKLRESEMYDNEYQFMPDDEAVSMLNNGGFENIKALMEHENKMVYSEPKRNQSKDFFSENFMSNHTKKQTQQPNNSSIEKLLYEQQQLINLLVTEVKSLKMYVSQLNEETTNKKAKLMVEKYLKNKGLIK